MNYRIRIARQVRSTTQDKSRLTIFLRVFPVWSPDENFIISTKMHTNVDSWHDIKKIVKGNSMDALRMNAQITKLETEIHDKFTQYLHTATKPIVRDFKNFLSDELNGKSSKARQKVYIEDLFDRYLRLHNNNLCNKRKLRYSLVKRLIGDFNLKKFCKAQVTPDKLNYDYWYEFKTYLQETRDLKIATLNTYMKVLNAVVNDACKADIIPKYPFSNTRLDPFIGNIKYLGGDELERITTFKTNDSRLRNVRDCFIFACYTGISYSDLRDLTTDNIIYDRQSNQRFLELYRNKTSVKCTVPLSPITEAIIDYYKDRREILDSNKLLPVIHLNDYNQLLKTLAAHCKIDKKVSSHIARHTFATTVWLTNNGSIETLRNILGHTKLETTQNYGKIISTRIANEANQVFKNQHNNN